MSISVVSLNGGEVIAGFDAELASVIAGLGKPDANPSPVSVTLTVTVKPDEELDQAKLEVSIRSKYPSRKALKGKLFLATRKGGDLEAFDRDQMEPRLPFAEEEEEQANDNLVAINGGEN